MPGSDDELEGGAPAWEDSDDERLVVSLAVPRLRKLRLNESEKLINGKEYTRRLRRQFERLNPIPDWATSSEGRPTKRRRRSSASSGSSILSDDMDLDDNLSSLPLARLLQDSSAFTRTLDTTKKNKLRPEVINIQRAPPIPSTSSSAIASLAFHPQYPVLLSSGASATIYLHRIDPTALPIPNPQLTSVHVKNTPLSSTEFLAPTGDKIFFSGRRRFFHTWDLETGTIEKITRIYGHKDEQKTMENFKLSPCGRYMALIGSGRKGGGIINVLDSNTTQWIASARMEGRGGLADFAWWSDGEGLTIAGKGGEIGEWSLSKRAFLTRWIDDGAVGTTVLALGGGRNGPKALGGDRFVVIGSTSGIINIYDRMTWTPENLNTNPTPKPKRSFMQLTTPTSNLVFSPDGQLLVFSSRHKRDALRLVHLPSCTVYRNWPTSETPFGRVSAVAFSAGSDMLAVGNEKGKVRLWDIRS